MMLKLFLLKEMIIEFFWYMNKDEAINLLRNAGLTYTNRTLVNIKI